MKRGDFVLFPPGGGLLPVLFMIMFVIIIGTVIFRTISGVKRWQSNNQQPVLTVSTKIVSKRSEVHRHTSNNNGQLMDSTSTSYFVTFQVESGDRMELKVHGSDFGFLAEGDVGKLTFQGTRFQGFLRT